MPTRWKQIGGVYLSLGGATTSLGGQNLTLAALYFHLEHFLYWRSYILTWRRTSCIALCSKPGIGIFCRAKPVVTEIKFAPLCLCLFFPFLCLVLLLLFFLYRGCNFPCVYVCTRCKNRNFHYFLMKNLHKVYFNNISRYFFLFLEKIVFSKKKIRKNPFMTVNRNRKS